MKRIIIIIIVLVIIGAVIVMGSGKDEESSSDLSQDSAAVQTSVFIAGSSDVQEETGLSLYGQVVSTSRLEVVPEISGLVERVNYRLGNVVRPGDVVVVLENDSFEAQLDQARSTFETAQTQYTQITKEAESQEVASLESVLSAAQASLDGTKQNILGSLDGLYASLEATIKGNFDQTFFADTNTDYPEFRIDLDSSKEELALGQSRRIVEESFDTERRYDDTAGALNAFEITVNKSIDLLNEIRVVVEEQETTPAISQNTIEGWQGVVTLTQSALDGLLAQVTSLRSNLDQNEKQLLSAQANLDDLLAGADNEELTIARLAVEQAQAGLRSAEIALEKTFVKAPVLGNIAAIDLRRGELVGPGSSVFTIANESALRIDAKIAPSFARQLNVGDRVLIDGLYSASVSTISSSVDESTGQVDIEIILGGNDTRLLSGMGVSIEVFPTTRDQYITIPISAVFVRDNISYVYVVQDMKATVREIIVEELFGEQIVVKDGLEQGEAVVANARAVDDNDIITITN